jgi:hypothetical protein
MDHNLQAHLLRDGVGLGIGTDAVPMVETGSAKGSEGFSEQRALVVGHTAPRTSETYDHNTSRNGTEPVYHSQMAGVNTPPRTQGA